ncbi:MAG: TolC family protein [Candidatus Eremiobacteraeota bacterium]|nr:TolC family protein [Candidatus Eremiobacteraeota bacterium]
MMFAALLAALPVFSQLSLSDAQQRTVANSASVAQARASVVSRDAALSLARNGGVPHLSADYSLAPQAGQVGDSTVEQHIFTVGANVSVNDLLGATAATRAAAADLIAAQRDADSAVLAARRKAISLYFAALQAAAVERVRQEAVEGARQDLRAADLRSRSGDAPRLDAVRAGVTLAQADADLARAQADRANAIDALASAANVSSSSLGGIADGAAPLPSPAPIDETHSVARALALRPEITSLLATIDARTADADAARMAGLPTLTALGGYASGVDSGLPVNGPAATVHLDVPLAPGTGDRVRAAQAQVSVVRAELVEERRTIALEVAAAVRDERAAESASVAADRANAEAQRALAAVDLGYREGASSSLDVSEARRVATQASGDALVARYQLAQSRALLEVLVP